ncbi:HD domain-containing phosphohydrolase [Lysobacter yangpyeongensis]|uniref:HD domain-containing phosphohydrolase n=1 Tax=Lysobacter yangpyeongensis TaxID=346182 RepID=A0ABW0SLB9_9GAMM
MSGRTPLYLQAALGAVLLVAATATATHAFDTGTGTLAVAIGLAVIGVVLALAFARRVARPLEQLALEADAVRRFDFRDFPQVRSPVREIDRLAQGFDLMRDAMRRFLALNQRLAEERDLDALLPWLLRETMGVFDATAGVLYLATNGEDGLAPVARHGLDAGFDPVRLESGGLHGVLGTALRTGTANAGHLDGAQLALLGLGDAAAERYAIALPLLDRKDQRVGLLLLFPQHTINAHGLAFAAALAASAAMALETRRLMRDQKELLQAVIRMVAAAIDAQSPYTGGHCERVPELTFMLARAACEAREGPFAGFALDADEWEAVHIAAWLHDCGKVTTPEFVVDKATKLETLYDRIHEVRMRFEVLKRDADIVYWRGVAQGGDEAVLRAARDATWQRLDEEFAFVAACNTGGEFLSAERQARLRAIGTQTWRRTLDDRLGLSRDELERRPAVEVALPAEEPLLADRPEHRIPRPQDDGIASVDDAWGFRMDVPELLYNRGELHNLTVSRGTLSAEERYKINEHIVQTIVMLSQLPFPAHLRNVPEIAGGHHEKMDGTGYPRGLTREQMSPVARMMAIADIFEALTAADRPYKSGKKLSEALSIMAKMRREQHIDADLFELFLRSGLHVDYATRFLKPEQIDDVVIEDYLQGA